MPVLGVAGVPVPAQLLAVTYALRRRDKVRGRVWHLAELRGTADAFEYETLCGVHRRTAAVRVPDAVRRAGFTDLPPAARCQRCLQVLAELRGVAPSMRQRTLAARRRARGEDVSDSYDDFTFDPDGRPW